MESSVQAPVSPGNNQISYASRYILFLAYVSLDAGSKFNLEITHPSNSAATTAS
jgi:hypothetical protein